MRALLQPLIGPPFVMSNPIVMILQGQTDNNLPHPDISHDYKEEGKYYSQGHPSHCSEVKLPPCPLLSVISSVGRVLGVSLLIHLSNGFYNAVCPLEGQKATHHVGSYKVVVQLYFHLNKYKIRY